MRVATPTDHAVMQCCDSSDTFCQLLKPTNFGCRNNVQPGVGRARRAERRRCTTCPASRRYLLAGSAALLALLDGATLPSPAHAAVGAPCRSSKTNYELTKCLRARRKETEEVCTTLLQCAPHQRRAVFQEWLIVHVMQTGEDGELEDIEDVKMKLRQYEQPGVLVTLPSGIQYRCARSQIVCSRIWTRVSTDHDLTENGGVQRNRGGDRG